jgi:hypothetical protein
MGLCCISPFDTDFSSSPGSGKPARLWNSTYHRQYGILVDGNARTSLTLNLEGQNFLTADAASSTTPSCQYAHGRLAARSSR